MTVTPIDPRLRVVARDAADFAQDCAVIAGRDLTTFLRTRRLVVTALVLPVMSVVLFSYVFGMALGDATGAGTYREFVMAGIFTLTVVFNGMFTAIGTSEDLRLGVADRFRSMPISRFAPVAGRMAADLVVNAVVIVVMALVGLLVGWRFHGNLWDMLVAMAVLLFFGCAVSGAASVIGSVSGGGESTVAAFLIPAFPAVFMSTAFVATTDLPGPLRAVAEWNPVSAVISVVRLRSGNPMLPDGTLEPTTWVARHATTYSLLSTTLLLVITVWLLLVIRPRR